MEIRNLPLSTRTINALAHNNIFTLEDLTNHPHKFELDKYCENIGKKAMAEIKAYIDNPIDQKETPGIDKYLQMGQDRGQRLNHYKMLKEITALVESEFCAEMEMKTMPNSQVFSQEEATQMAEMLARIYSIAHCIHCHACQTQYLN